MTVPYRILVVMLVTAAATQTLAAEYTPPELLFWARADTLGLRDGDKIDTWDDASGTSRALIAPDGQAPSFAAKGSGGYPAVVFHNLPKAKPKTVESLIAAFNEAEHRGLTVFVVGAGLQQSNWLSTSTGKTGDIKLSGDVAHTGSTCKLSGFHNLASGGVHLAELSGGIGDDGAFHLASFADGRALEHADDPEPNSAVWLTALHLGRGFNGEICEILLYDNVLSENDRASVEAFLMAKYGLAPNASASTQPPGLRTVPPPHTTALRPALQGLKVWLSADDIKGKAGDDIATWPNEQYSRAAGSAPG